MLIDLVENLKGTKLHEKKTERYPQGRGSYRRSDKVTTRKSKVPIYKTIKDALSKTSAGTIFSTKGSYRMYVTTAGGWGSSKQQRVGGKTAKGFTPGSSTPNSDWKSIRSHAARTKAKHGSTKSKAAEVRKDRREKDKPKKYSAKAKRRM